MRLIVLLFVCQAPAALAADPAKWFACESSDDCVLAKGPCGSATAINRSFRGPFEKNAKKMVCKKSTDYKVDRRLKNAGCGIDGKCVTGVNSQEMN